MNKSNQMNQPSQTNGFHWCAPHPATAAVEIDVNDVVPI
jgi:hypothetical protein